MAKPTKREWLERELVSQRDWVREHGGDLAGYIERYGRKEDPEHFGDGGEAIFEADSAHLRDLEERVRRLGPAKDHPVLRSADAFEKDFEDGRIEATANAVRAKRAALVAAGDPHNVAPIIAALGVILLDRRSRGWLARYDRKAYEQAHRALGVEV